jgi:hypothetical protein
MFIFFTRIKKRTLGILEFLRVAVCATCNELQLAQCNKSLKLVNVERNSHYKIVTWMRIRLYEREYLKIYLSGNNINKYRE